MTIDPAGNLYIADAVNNRIRKLATNGIITTIAGTGKAGYSGDGGPALSATLQIPEQAEMDVFGNLYIADSYNNVIRKVGTNGIITTVAGNGFGASSEGATGAYAGDGGLATKAELNLPISFAIDPSDNLWISDQANNVIRYVSASTGIITTVAGVYNDYNYTGDGGPGLVGYFCSARPELRAQRRRQYLRDRLHGNNVCFGSYIAQRQHPNGGRQWERGLQRGWRSGDESRDGFSTAGAGVGTFGDIYIADSYNSVIRKADAVRHHSAGQTTNAFGNIRVLAANTWVIIKGENLAPAGVSRIWQTSDFVNNQLPTALSGVSVTMNGTNAYVYYISPTPDQRTGATGYLPLPEWRKSKLDQQQRRRKRSCRGAGADHLADLFRIRRGSLRNGHPRQRLPAWPHLALSRLQHARATRRDHSNLRERIWIDVRRGGRRIRTAIRDAAGRAHGHHRRDCGGGPVFGLDFARITVPVQRAGARFSSRWRCAAGGHL